MPTCSFFPLTTGIFFSCGYVIAVNAEKGAISLRCNNAHEVPCTVSKCDTTTIAWWGCTVIVLVNAISMLGHLAYIRLGQLGQVNYTTTIRMC